MAKRQGKPQPPSSRTVTPERAARLYQLLELLAGKPQTRAALKKLLKLDVRGFYRDLELLRETGIPVVLTAGRYALGDSLKTSADRLPFPDPALTLGEAKELAKGRGRVQRKLRALIGQVVGT